MKRSSTRLGLLVFPALLLAATLNADTLVLRDGRRIDGQLISVRDGVVEFEDARSFGGRTLRLTRDEVVGIEFDRNDRNTSRSSTPPPSQSGRPPGLRERVITVPATVRSVDTNIDVRPGQDIYFEATGEVRWGPNRRDGPAGEQNSPTNPNRPMPNRPGAALIGSVGAGSQDYFYIGADRGPIRMRSSGRLFLSVNDDYVQDNSGSFRVVVYY